MFAAVQVRCRQTVVSFSFIQFLGRLQIGYDVDHDGDQDSVVGKREDGVPEERSTVVDGRGIPLGTVTAEADRHDSPMLVQ